MVGGLHFTMQRFAGPKLRGVERGGACDWVLPAKKAEVANIPGSW